MVNIGPFELVRELGSGATGSVWVARHRDQQVEVALKMVNTERVQDNRNWVLFRNEMRALARLRHPGIVTLLAVGEVTQSEALNSAGKFSTNTLYIAMELAGDTLVDASDTIDGFEPLRRCLLQLLDALAHAHARGVIHRDIKPANVLVSPHSGAPIYKLADFGVAHALQDPYAAQNDRLANCGTPSYMAPEQISGEMRDQGSWTDIYALGCLAFYLSTGQAPFTGSLGEVIAAHLTSDVPPLHTSFRVPAGFETLVKKMLSKRIGSRYQRAADVARDLLALPSPARLRLQRAPLTKSAVLHNKPPPTKGLGGMQLMAQPANSFALDLAVDDSASGSDRTMPTAWRRSGSSTVPLRLLGVGISLYHLRPVPWVNRDEERDVLWQALRAAAEQRKPSAIVVRGDAGVGKTRLAEWLTERAHELGAATPLCATHAPIDGRADGIAATVARFLRLEELAPTTAAERLGALMEEALGVPASETELRLLVDILRGEQSASSANATPPQNHRAGLMRLVQMVAQERPVVLWVDDAQWAASEINFCRYVLDNAHFPVLLLLTVREENLDDHTGARAALDALLMHEHAAALWLKPLSYEHQHELVAQLLQLDGELARWVAARTEGNPLFAVQLIGDWVERSVLTVGKNGLVLASAQPSLPESIHALWRVRIDGLWTRLKKDCTPALEVAALLGNQVHGGEWRDVCSSMNIDIADDLVPTMVAMRLAQQLAPISLTPDSATTDDQDAVWSFAHGMLRETITRISADAGRSRRFHQACAEVLKNRGAPAQRVAEHLLSAHAWSEALAPLLEAAEAAARQGDFDRALAFDRRRNEALDRGGYHPTAPERVRGWLRRARTLCLRGEVDEAKRLLTRARKLVGKAGDVAMQADLAWAATGVARATNEYDTGIAMARRAVRCYQQLNDTGGVARGDKRLGELLRITGAIRPAIRHYLNAQRGFERVGDQFEVAWTLMGLSACHRQLGDPLQAAAHARAGLAIFESLGSRVGIGHAHNELGEAARVAGQHRQAETHYMHALKAWQADKHRDCSIVRVNLAFSALGAGNYSRASTILDAVVADARARNREALQVFALVGLCECAAAERQWLEVAEYANEAERLVGKLDVVDLDIAQCITRAAEHAYAAHAVQLAKRLAELAIPQWQTLGHRNAAAKLQALVSTV